MLGQPCKISAKFECASSLCPQSLQLRIYYIMDQANVSRLIAVARDGSSSSQKDAKATLLAHFRDYIRLLAHLHMKSVLSAKFDESDIVQETFLQADRAFDQFRGDCEKELAAWLRRIMANKGADLARGYLSGKRDIQMEVQLQENFDASSLNIGNMIPSENSTPSKLAIQRERSVQLATAISKIRGDKREVLILHGLQGISIPDVAQSMGRTETSTWKLWARGLQELRRYATELT